VPRPNRIVTVRDQRARDREGAGAGSLPAFSAWEGVGFWTASGEGSGGGEDLGTVGEASRVRLVASGGGGEEMQRRRRARRAASETVEGGRGRQGRQMIGWGGVGLPFGLACATLACGWLVSCVPRGNVCGVPATAPAWSARPSRARRDDEGVKLEWKGFGALVRRAVVGASPLEISVCCGCGPTQNFQLFFFFYRYGLWLSDLRPQFELQDPPQNSVLFPTVV
jgi:hypothetical protein